MTAAGLAEKFLQPLSLIVEDPFDIPPHEKPVHQRPAARAIADVVGAKGAAVALFEGVRVRPERVRPAQLNVDEAMRLLPLRNLRAPADGKTMRVIAAVNERPGLHLDRWRRQHLELQLGPHDGIQVSRLGEKGKDFAAWARKPEFGFQRELVHGRGGLKPGLDATRACGAPAPQGFEQAKHACRRQQQREPERYGPTEGRAHKQHHTHQAAHQPAFAINVTGEESFHGLTFLEAARN